MVAMREDNSGLVDLSLPKPQTLDFYSSISFSLSSFWKILVADAFVLMVKKTSSFMLTLIYTCHSTLLDFMSISKTGRPSIGFVEIYDDELIMALITM